MKLTVNGAEREPESPPLASLLTVLREELEILSPKAGCEQGGCGACTVLVDGEPRRACLVPLAAATVGLLLLAVVKLLPWVGIWAWTVATFIGVGAALSTKLGRREPWLVGA